MDDIVYVHLSATDNVLDFWYFNSSIVVFGSKQNSTLLTSILSWWRQSVVTWRVNPSLLSINLNSSEIAYNVFKLTSESLELALTASESILETSLKVVDMVVAVQIFGAVMSPDPYLSLLLASQFGIGWHNPAWSSLVLGDRSGHVKVRHCCISAALMRYWGSAGGSRNSYF